MRVHLRSLQSRIAIAFVALICVVQIGAFVAVGATGSSTTQASLTHDVEIGANVLNRLFDQEAGQLEQGARLIVSNADVAAIARSGNTSALSSAVAIQGIRIGAELTILTSLDGRILGRVKSSLPVGSSFPKRELLAQAQTRGSTRGVIDIDNLLYRVVVVPILAPEPAGWAIMGLRLDDTDARDLSKLTGLEVSFFFRRASTGWTQAGSTLAENLVDELTRSLDAAPRAKSAEPQVLSVGNVDTMTMIVPRISTDGTEVIAVLQRPAAESMQPFRTLQRTLAGTAGVALVLTLLFSVLIARGVSKPVKALTLTARGIASQVGDEPATPARGDEIGELTVAFEQMKDRVVAREKKMQEVAYRDEVTLLPNRALFIDRLEQAIRMADRSKTPITVVTMDLDRFKEINDTLGHQAGDLVLIEVARRLRKALRRKSDTIARMAGDEFALLMPDTKAVDSLPLLLRVRKALETPFELEGRLVDVRASIGAATYPGHGDDAITLLRHADLAMYNAKQNASVIAFFEPAFDRSSREPTRASADAKEALRSDEAVV